MEILLRQYQQYDLLKGIGELLDKKLSIFIVSNKTKREDQSLALQFEAITSGNLQACDIDKENNDVHISAHSIEEEIDTKIEAKVEIDISEEANSKGISIQKLLKQLYEKDNPVVGLFGKSLESLTITFSMGHQN